jgi:hypothetical protein
MDNMVSKIIWEGITLSKKETFIRKAVDKTLASKILRSVKSHEGFWFCNATGDFTGKNATSLNDFAKMLRVVDVQSIDFHFSRGDFRRWIQLIIGDIELSVRINRIPQDTRGEKLRDDLTAAVNERINELKKI